MDASFHFGVQYSGDQGDWSTGVAHSAALTHQAFPTMHASVMIWPDNDERNGGGTNGFFSAPQVQNMVTAGLPEVDGPFIVYEHQLATGTQDTATGTPTSTPSTTPSAASADPTGGDTRHPNQRQGHRAQPARWPRRVLASGMRASVAVGTPEDEPLRRTVTGPSSLTTITVAGGRRGL